MSCIHLLFGIDFCSTLILVQELCAMIIVAPKPVPTVLQSGESGYLLLLNAKRCARVVVIDDCESHNWLLLGARQPACPFATGRGTSTNDVHNK